MSKDQTYRYLEFQKIENESKNVKQMLTKTSQVWCKRHKYIDSRSSVQFSSVTQSCLTLCNPVDHSTPGLPVHHQLPESTQTHESMMASNHLILCHPLLLLPSIFPSTRVFSNESALRIRWPKYWSFSFSFSFQ